MTRVPLVGVRDSWIIVLKHKHVYVWIRYVIHLYAKYQPICSSRFIRDRTTYMLEHHYNVLYCSLYWTSIQWTIAQILDWWQVERKVFGYTWTQLTQEVRSSARSSASGCVALNWQTPSPSTPASGSWFTSTALPCGKLIIYTTFQYTIQNPSSQINVND